VRLAAIIAGVACHEPPDVAWLVVDALVVGVVVGDESVVLVVPDAAAETVVLAVLDAAAVVAVEAAVVGDAVALVALVVAALVAARAANNPTPATDAAATAPVTARLRRNQASRREGDVMSPIYLHKPQNDLSVCSVFRHKFLRTG
jgi:hypothetical protein